VSILLAKLNPRLALKSPSAAPGLFHPPSPTSPRPLSSRTAGAFVGSLDEPLCGTQAPTAVAARCGQTGVLAFLLALGARADGRDSNGWTLAHIAAHQGRVAVLQLLLTASDGLTADDLFAATTPSGATPIFLAAQEGHHGAVVYLVTRGPHVSDAPRNDGCSPFFIACQEGHLACAVALAPEARLTRTTSRGSTALHGAVLQVGLLRNVGPNERWSWETAWERARGSSDRRRRLLYASPRTRYPP
jgi:hypothetical protein